MWEPGLALLKQAQVGDAGWVVLTAILSIVVIALCVRQYMRDLDRTAAELDAKRRNYMPLVVVIALAFMSIPSLANGGSEANLVDEYVLYALAALSLAWLFVPGIRFRAWSVWPAITALALADSVYAVVTERETGGFTWGDGFTAVVLVIVSVVQVVRTRRHVAGAA